LNIQGTGPHARCCPDYEGIEGSVTPMGKGNVSRRCEMVRVIRRNSAYVPMTETYESQDEFFTFETEAQALEWISTNGKISILYCGEAHSFIDTRKEGKRAGVYDIWGNRIGVYQSAEEAKKHLVAIDRDKEGLTIKEYTYYE
jgi:hypothetical protein